MQPVNGVITEAMKYVSKGDGKSITLNGDGKKLFKDFIKNSGGVQRAVAVLPFGRSTVSTLKNSGRCKPDTWVAIYEIIKQHAA